jgi:hypothetical protein
MGGRGFFGLDVGVKMDCGQELYKGLMGVVYVRKRAFVGGDFFWRQSLLLGSLFVVNSSYMRYFWGC